MTSITKFHEGDIIRIRLLECGLGFQKRMAELGIFAGAEIEIAKNDGRGPLLVKVFDSKIVLGQSGAQKIYGDKI
ncbi:MAG: FeoA family protein [Candidatus Paceibacterota bacterium]|jgi:Fe2+ transport system protein FeoA